MIAMTMCPPSCATVTSERAHESVNTTSSRMRKPNPYATGCPMIGTASTRFTAREPSNVGIVRSAFRSAVFSCHIKTMFLSTESELDLQEQDRPLMQKKTFGAKEADVTNELLAHLSHRRFLLPTTTGPCHGTIV